jgi:hypothetical protein
MVGWEEVFESTAQYPLFRYSIPRLPEAAQFGGTPACQWSRVWSYFYPGFAGRSQAACHIAGCGTIPCSCPNG